MSSSSQNRPSAEPVISASALLDAWEGAWTLPVTDRPASLLTLADPACRPHDLSVGQCDAVLFALYRRLFGDTLEATTRCPGCGQDVDLTLPMDRLAPDPGSPPDRIEVRVGPYDLHCRVLSNRDLSALSAFGADVLAVDVLERCLIGASGPDGAQIAARDLPDAVTGAALQAVADSDPAAHVLLALTCPCGHEWIDQLDIRTVLWSELDSWGTRLLHDVDHLARHYGWAEPDVLVLSPWRRAWYVEATR